jgi:hypothetical protein
VSYYYDPDVLEQHEDTRRGVLIKALLYGPGAVVVTVLFIYALRALLQGNMGALFATIIMGLITFAVDFEALAAFRDLRSEPTTTEGRVLRIWRKGRVLFFGRVHYLLIERKVFEVDAVTAAEAREGEPVRIEHWPHTNKVISVRKVRTAAGAQDES